MATASPPPSDAGHTSPAPSLNSDGRPSILARKSTMRALSRARAVGRINSFFKPSPSAATTSTDAATSAGTISTPANSNIDPATGFPFPDMSESESESQNRPRAPSRRSSLFSRLKPRTSSESQRAATGIATPPITAEPQTTSDPAETSLPPSSPPKASSRASSPPPSGPILPPPAARSPPSSHDVLRSIFTKDDKRRRSSIKGAFSDEESGNDSDSMSVRRARAAAAVPTYVSDVDSGMIPSADSSMHKLSGDEADRERAAGRSRLGASSPATTAVPNTPVPMLKDHLSEPQSMVDEPEEMSDYFGAGPSQSSPENVAPQPISPPVDAEVTPVTEPPVTKPEVSNVEPAPSMPMPKPEEPRVPELIPTVTPVVVEPATPPPEAERAAPPRPPVLQTAALNPLSDPRLRDAPPLLSAVDEGDEPASAKFSVPPTTIHEEPVFRNEVSPLSAPPSMPEPEPSAPQTPPPTMAYAEPIQSESESQSRLALSSRLPIPLELDSQPAPRVQPDVRDFVSSIPPPEPQAAPQAVATPYFPEESRYVSPPLPQTQQLNMPEPRPDIKSRVPDSPPAYLQSDTVYTPPLPLEDPPYLSLDPRKAKAFGFPEPAAYRPDPVVVSNGYTNGHSKTDEDDQKAQNGGIRRNENGFEVLPSPADSLASRYLPGSLDPSTLSYAPPDPTTAIPFSLFFNVVFNNPFQSLLRPFTHISPYSSPRQRPASPEERPQEMSLDRSQDNAQDVANNYANAMASDPGTVDRFVSVLKCHSYIPLLGSPYLSLTLPIPRIVSEIFTWAWDFFWSDDDDDQFDGAQDANREAARGQNYNREAAEPVPQDG